MTKLASPSLKSEWPIVAPEEAGFASTLGRKLAAGIESGLLRDLHAVLVCRGGEILLEHYGIGADESWGQSLGTVTFTADTLHDLRSVTKSVVGLLYGIACERGLVPEPGAPLLAQFPEYSDLARDGARARLTVAHALTMTLGLEWDESRPYTDPRNSEIAMENAADRYRYILERPILFEPGERWTYSGGSVALLGALIARGSKKSLQDFAKEALFDPLGIFRYEWICGDDGTASAASGLRLTARDLARIGTLVLNKGEYRGNRIIAQKWIDVSLEPIIGTDDELQYGRLWFIGAAPAPAYNGHAPWIAGFGNGGQRLWLSPRGDITTVIFSGRYNAQDAWVTPIRIWREIVLANFERL